MHDDTPLARIIALLDAAQIPHMLAGSFASAYYGAARATQHIDLVVAPGADSLERLLDCLSPEAYYVSREAAREALHSRGMFNIIDLATGWKIDLIVCKSRPFSQEEMTRRKPARIASIDLWIASAEDTILSKLEWARQGESERQLRDVAGMIAAVGDELDDAYLARWAEALDIAPWLDRARALARR